MPINDAAARGHVCPHIRDHVIDIDQPPGIGVSPIADIDIHAIAVSVALATNSNAEMPKNTCRDVAVDAEAAEISQRRALPLASVAAADNPGRRTSVVRTTFTIHPAAFP
jgi:hypothetical protein